MGGAEPSPLMDLMDNEDFTLEQLLEQDELIQEAKSRNEKLIELWGIVEICV